MLANVAWPQAPMPGSNLLYIFRTVLSSTEINASDLNPLDLLIPPVWTNNQGWRRGFHVTLWNAPIQKTDWLESHAFRDVFKGTVDLEGNPRTPTTGLIGEWGLASCRWIDDRMSEALGIPAVPIDAD